MKTKCWKKALCFGMSIFMLGAVFAGCTKKEDEPSGEDNPPAPSPSPEPIDEPFSVKYREDYTLTKLKSAAHNDDYTELADGVHLVKNTVVKSNDYISVVYSVEVNLKKAGIAIGTNGNKTYDFDWDNGLTALPYDQATAWENATGKKVYASVNADYLRLDGGHRQFLL